MTPAPPDRPALAAGRLLDTWAPFCAGWAFFIFKAAVAVDFISAFFR